MKAYSDIKQRIKTIGNQTLLGEINSLEAMISLRQDKYQLQECIKLIEQFESDNLEKICADVDSYGGTYKGFEFQVRSGGRTWNFKTIPEWIAIEAQKKAIEAKYKGYFEAAQSGALMATADGEEIPMPEISYRRASVIISKPK